MALSQRAHELLHQNTKTNDVPLNKSESFIIANPLANVSAPPSPSSERKESYNLMVKVVPSS